jgi:hypothetical protein
MNAAINVSVAVTTSHAIAASAPVVSSRTMTPPRVPFWPQRCSPAHKISQKAGWSL